MRIHTRFLPALATTCDGNFGSFVADLRQEAISCGYDPANVDRFFTQVRQDPAVLRADGAQGVFQKPFTEFAQRLISSNRLKTGRAMANSFDAVIDRIETQYGVSRGILLSFWAFETDFGGFQGDFNTLNALVTLAYDCRRQALFRPQVFAALTLFGQGDFDPLRTTGAWAGEIGMVQMLPQDILDNGGDGDGHVSLKTSAPDAATSGLARGRAVAAGSVGAAGDGVVPDRSASTENRRRMGHAGGSAQPLAIGRSTAHKYFPLGAGRRAAVQDAQQKLRLPADAWPTRDLLERL